MSLAAPQPDRSGVTSLRAEAPVERAVSPSASAAAVALGALTLSHLVTDAYTALLTPLLPAIRSQFGVSIAQTALLVTIAAFVGSMLQPVFGLLADRGDRRVLLALGPVVCGLGMTMLGFAPTFTLVALLVALGGVGSGVFHPAAIGFVHTVSAAGRRGLFAALFAGGGTAGVAIGPLAATAVGLGGLHWFLPVGVGAALLTWFTAPRPSAVRQVPRSWREYAAVFRGPLRLLWATSVLRSLSTVSYTGLLGFLLTARGDVRHLGPSLAAFSLSAAVGGIVGGILSDRMGRITVLRSSILGTIPLFVALVYTTPGAWWYYPLTMVVGGLVNANLPVTVVAAQEYAPDHVATASALMMGFAWGTSGLLFLAIGWVADLTSPQVAMIVAILALMPAFWLTLRLPEPARAQSAAR